MKCSSLSCIFMAGRCYVSATVNFVLKMIGTLSARQNATYIWMRKNCVGQLSETNAPDEVLSCFIESM